ncbi:MAG: polymerase sigma factor [Cohnella sp.]|nr:polymerase sigma factor [Cohnella sp.]
MSVTSSYESMVKPHLDDLRNYCFYLTRSKWDGEDLFQEALLKAMMYFLNTEPYHDVKPFLIRVARNLWIDDCRARQRRRHSHLQNLPLFYIDSNYAEVRSLIEWMADRLPRRNVETWLLSEYFGYSMQDIADTLKCTVPAVKSVMHRTRRLLRKWNQEEDIEADQRKIARLDVERWTRAILQDLPPCL